MGRFAVILPAAGRSSRFGDPAQKKTYTELDGRPVWLRSLRPFLNHDQVGQVIIAVAEDDREEFERRHRDEIAFFGLDVVTGGAERADTVAAALAKVKGSCDFVAVHDAARPCVTTALIASVFAAALERGAAMPAIPVADTIKRAEGGTITATVPRAGLHLAQTPQVFRRDWLIEAYARLDPAVPATDDAQLVEAIGHPVAIVPGSAFNLKITTRDDLRLARAILKVQEEEAEARTAGDQPVADERTTREGTPELRASDLFG